MSNISPRYNKLQQLKYPKELAKDVAAREKTKRKARGLTQKTLSERSGVSLASLKRFEQTGEISFVSLVKIADVLGERASIEQIFGAREYASIQEVIDERSRETHRAASR